jgi:hypothetical protein
MEVSDGTAAGKAEAARKSADTTGAATASADRRAAEADSDTACRETTPSDRGGFCLVPRSIVIVPAHRRMRGAAFSASSLRAVASPLSNPFNLNPQRMLLDLGHQQDFGLLLFSYLKGVRSGDALTLRVDGQGQSQSI